MERGESASEPLLMIGIWSALRVLAPQSPFNDWNLPDSCAEVWMKFHIGERCASTWWHHSTSQSSDDTSVSRWCETLRLVSKWNHRWYWFGAACIPGPRGAAVLQTKNAFTKERLRIVLLSQVTWPRSERNWFGEGLLNSLHELKQLCWGLSLSKRNWFTQTVTACERDYPWARDALNETNLISTIWRNGRREYMKQRKPRMKLVSTGCYQSKYT